MLFLYSFICKYKERSFILKDGIFYTVEEAAEKLKVNPETIRRRIRKGNLKAQLINGDRGKQYSIPAGELMTEEATLVPEAKLPQSIIDQIAAANTKAMHDTMAAQFAAQEEKYTNAMRSMENEIKSLRNEMRAIQEEHNTTIQLLTEQKKEPSFWKKWFS